ncbi:MAG: hypothetical protein WCD76_09275, partial [Pyrinomonadaceae bacterium]
MALFWRRKKEDRYITLGLNEPATKPAEEHAKTGEGVPLETPANNLEARGAQTNADILTPALEPVPTGGEPTPHPARETGLADTSKREVIKSPPAITPAKPREAAPGRDGGASKDRSERPSTTPPPPSRPVTPTRSPFTTSVLGLDRSIEELQAQEAALEQAFANR